MNTLRVMLDDFVLRALVPGSRFLAFAVAFRAQDRNIRRKRRRIRIQFPQNVMRTVTLFARGAVGVIFRHQLTMRADLELLTNLRVTCCAIHFLRDRFARANVRDAHLRVALAARDFRVS